MVRATASVKQPFPPYPYGLKSRAHTQLRKGKMYLPDTGRRIIVYYIKINLKTTFMYLKHTTLRLSIPGMWAFKKRDRHIYKAGHFWGIPWHWHTCSPPTASSAQAPMEYSLLKLDAPPTGPAYRPGAISR